ncbi:MAG: plasmid mobilization protein [Polyangiales bacterium]
MKSRKTIAKSAKRAKHAKPAKSTPIAKPTKSKRRATSKPVAKSKRRAKPSPKSSRAPTSRPKKQREAGGRKVTTGRRVPGAGEARVRFSADESAQIAEAARRAGKSVSAYLRDLGRRDAETRPTDVDAEPGMEWHASFVDFFEESLGYRLTRGQRAFARVAYDGADPVDLTDPLERSIAIEIFGGLHTIPKTARGVLVWRKGRASGGSFVSAAHCLYRMLVADLSRCGPGDIPAVCIISPRKETSRVIANYARTFSAHPLIEPMIVASSQDGFTIRRDGREVQFLVTPKSMGGAAVRGLSLIEVVIDEAEFVPPGSPDAVVQDGDLIDATMPRLLPGGLLVLVSTPWGATSATAASFAKNYGHSVDAVAVCAPTLIMRDNDPEIARLIDRERLRNPANAAREFDCLVSDSVGGAFFDPSTIALAVTTEPIVPTRKYATAGVDPAFVHDAFAFAVVERQGDLMVVVDLQIVAPERNRPLIPSVVMGTFARRAREFGCSIVATDSHRVSTVREHAAIANLATVVRNTEETMIALREILREGRLRIPNDKRLIAQLRGVTYRPRSGGGLTISSPRSREAGHGDLVSALAMACAQSPRNGAAAIAGAAALMAAMAAPARPRSHAPNITEALMLGNRRPGDRI